MKKFYTESTTIGKIHQLLKDILVLFTGPTGRRLALMIAAILVCNGIESVRGLFLRFLEPLAGGALSAWYYFMKHAKRPAREVILKRICSLVLKLIPESLREARIYLLLDDTLIPKFGKKFDGIARLFDHADHTGQPYKNAHCFVALMLCVPIGLKENGSIRYLAIPVGWARWKKADKDGTEEHKTKHMLARELVAAVADTFPSQPFTMLFDSWYLAQELIQVLDGRPQLNVCCAARITTSLYRLPSPPTGKRGRPKVRGDQLVLTDFLLFTNVKEGYLCGARPVLTSNDLFRKRTVMAYVTLPADNPDGSYRLFLSTILPEDCPRYETDEEPWTPFTWLAESASGQAKARLEKKDKKLRKTMAAGQSAKGRLLQYRKNAARRTAVPAPAACLTMFTPYLEYQRRWSAEVVFYELKTFWDLEHYKVRKAMAIDMFVQIVSMAYSVMLLLPYADSSFAHLQDSSAQEVRRELAHRIQSEIFTARLVRWLERSKIGSIVINKVREAASGLWAA